MIEVKNLSKRFGEFEAVKEISFNVSKGDILGFLGPNGAGKSTTMRILTCYMPATSGSAVIDGYDIFSQSNQVKRRIGYLPEVPPLYSEMTVKQYLNFVMQIRGLEKARRKERLQFVLSKCGLGDVQNRIIENLSRGYKQRCGIAQAIVHDPAILILDEPTQGLDPRQIVEIRDLIRSLASEHTIILSTHILPEVTMLCSRAIIINRGKIIGDKPLADLTANKSLESVFLELISRGEVLPDSFASPPPVEEFHSPH
jgi:ABC-2 type transport system ATP-binding protein